MRQTALLMGCALLFSSGCAATFSERARNGITFYCPGAGNTDFGDVGLREGLEQAGYRGEVAAFIWTISFNVALDQTLRFNAHLRAHELARLIREYRRQNPDQICNLVGLSAGTGVAIWALEQLPDGVQVDNVVLLGSSLSHDYDVSRAAAHVAGKIYVYYSPHDAILAGPMKVFGTIDGKFGVDGAGSVGLHSPRAASKIVNNPWRPNYQSLGYYGGHVDGTSPRFVRAVLAKHLLQPASGRMPAESIAGGTAPLAARRDRPAPSLATATTPAPASE
ncbi:MAG: hypothetical protein CHACPFDD_02058 [Phycisphaerae bacterium]|nr:hypothetical protein [Phycisphaerae bacterium]